MTYEQFEPWFRALKAARPFDYRKAIEYAEGVTLRHNLPLKVGAEIEQATVMLACELLGIKPA